jgi:flavin reductase (DIM6/NTAB) family NADH-FMN oxidoreductase RutF
MENGIFFKRVTPETPGDNVFKLIGDDWMLITAGDEHSFNTMTASWGGLGILWHKPVSFCFVRPSRYTFEFMEKGDRYTFSFFTEKYRKALNLLGSKSGRDGDKISEAGLTPVPVEHGAVAFKEARLVVVSKKLYYQDLNPRYFCDPGIAANYPKKDYHRLYVGEVKSVLTPLR